jgi:hypothetical protein
MTPPRIEAVTAPESGVLSIRWTTGETLTAHISDWIERFGLLAPLRDPQAFAQAQVGWCGHSVEWADGIDLGADQLYQRCRQEAGQPTPQMFIDWMQRNDLSLQTAADALGLSRRTGAYFRSGAKPLSRATWLACLGWETTRPEPTELPLCLPTAQQYAALHA